MSHPNSLLGALSAGDGKLFNGTLTQVPFVIGEVLAEPGAPIDRVFFPNSGMISVVVPLAGGEFIEAGVVGRADVFGAGVAFGARYHINRAIAQIPGSASVMKASDLIAAAKSSETLRRALFLSDQFMLAQAQQSAACNAKHTVPQRLATWLLRVRERAQQEDMPLTQEFLGQMLGVQRASVSIAASEMQDAGLIRYQRGTIRITDLPKLENVACECYAALRGQHTRMFTSSPPSIDASNGIPMDREGK